MATILEDFAKKNIDHKGLEDLEAFFNVMLPVGSLDKALTNNLYGINHRGYRGILPENRDAYGYVFFTRPQLNLSTVNLRNVRKMYSLLTKNEKTIHRYIRNMLDPRLAVSSSKSLSELSTIYKTSDYMSDAVKEAQLLMLTKVTCPMVDENQGFIPILTNLIRKCDGWPDEVLGSFTSKEGARREQWSIADSALDVYEVWDMNTTFKNVKDEPLSLLFQTWLRYIANEYEGMLSPYLDFIVENEIDYMTRIFRLVLDESKTFVKKISSTAAAFPINYPNGQFFDYDETTKYNDNTKDISIRFRCHGAEYNDDILIKEFNDVNCIFNSDYARYRYNRNESKLVEVPFNMLQYFNHRGYPYIDPDTLQLKWLVSTESKTYKNIVRYFKYRYKKDSSNHTLIWKRSGNNWNVGDIKEKIKYLE